MARIFLSHVAAKSAGPYKHSATSDAPTRLRVASREVGSPASLDATARERSRRENSTRTRPATIGAHARTNHTRSSKVRSSAPGYRGGGDPGIVASYSNDCTLA